MGAQREVCRQVGRLRPGLYRASGSRLVGLPLALTLVGLGGDGIPEVAHLLVQGVWAGAREQRPAFDGYRHRLEGRSRPEDQQRSAHNGPECSPEGRPDPDGAVPAGSSRMNNGG